MSTISGSKFSQVATLPHHPGEAFTSPIAINEDRSQLAAGVVISSLGKASQRQFVIKIWSLLDGREICTLGELAKSVTTLCFSPNGKFLVSGTQDKQMQVWDLPRQRRQYLLKMPRGKSLDYLVVNAANQLLLSTGNTLLSSDMQMWNLASGEMLYTAKAQAPIFTPDGNHLIYRVNSWKIWDQYLVLCDANSGKRQRVIYDHLTAFTNYLVCSPDGKILGVEGGSEDSSLQLIEMATGKLLSSQDYGIVAFSPKPHPRFQAYLAAVVYQPSGVLVNRLMQVMAAKKDPQTDYRRIMLRNTSTWEIMQRFTEYRETIVSLAISLDGKWVASGNQKGEVTIWDSNRVTEVATIKAHSGSIAFLAFCGNDSRLVSGSDEQENRIIPVDPRFARVKMLHLWSLGIR